MDKIIDIKILTYKTYGELLDRLTKSIKYYNKNFDCIFTFMRGGLPVATHLSHNIGKDIPIVLDENELKNYETILIVDDIIDTGKTFSELYNRYNNFKDKKFVLSTCIYHKLHSNFYPDVSVIYVKNGDTWIVFPYEDKNRINQDIEEYKKSRNLECHEKIIPIFETI